MEDGQRLWEEWCYYLGQNNSVDREDIFSQKIITLLEKMGWNQFDNELERERSMQVGSNQTIRSDILLHQKEHQKTVVIELKQPKLDFNESFRNQLFSYMRQIRADVGMLIGSSIELYYDAPNSAANMAPLLLFKLKINKAEKLGASFVRMLCKEHYGTTKCEQDLKDLAKQYKENLNQKSDSLILNGLKSKNESKRSAVLSVEGKETSKEVISILERWLSHGKKTPWGHNLKRGAGYSQAALIDACLCVVGGMTRLEIAQNSGVLVSRVVDHIENCLKTGRRNNFKAVNINSRSHNGKIYEYIDPIDQLW